MPYPAAKGNTGVPPVLASGHPDRCKSLVGGTPATRHSRDGHVALHEKAVAPYLGAAQNFGLSGLPLFRRAILPAALPRIIPGVRIALGVAWLVVLAAGMIPVNSGPGYLIIALDFLTCLTMRADLIRIWQAEKKTVLFVTHDIEEAVPLAVGSSAAVASDGNPTGVSD